MKKNNLIIPFFFLCLFLDLSQLAFFQQARRNKKAFNATGHMPLEGASSEQKEQSMDAIGNKSGDFVLKVNVAKPVIIFSSVGFQSTIAANVPNNPLFCPSKIHTILSSLSEVVTNKKIVQYSV